MVKQAPYSDQPKAQRMPDAGYCSLYIVVQGPGSFWGQSTFSYNIWFRSFRISKLPSFLIYAYFSYIQNAWDKPTAQGYIAECFWLFLPYCPNWCLLLVGFSSDVWWGSWGYPNFGLWEMPVYIHNATTCRVRSGPKTAQNASFAQGCGGCGLCSRKFWVIPQKLKFWPHE